MTFSKVHINTLGLMLATLGSFLVWRYIGDLDYLKPGLEKGQISLTVATSTPELVRKLKRERMLSKFGLALIVAGGVLQAITNYMP